MCEIVWDKVPYKNTKTSSVSSAERRSILKYDMFLLKLSHQSFKATIMIKVSKAMMYSVSKNRTWKFAFQKMFRIIFQNVIPTGEKKKVKSIGISWCIVLKYHTPWYIPDTIVFQSIIRNRFNCHLSNYTSSILGKNVIPVSALFEPAHVIMVLFVLRKLILQMRMRSHPLGLDVWFFGGTLRLLSYFIVANAQACLSLCDTYHNLMSWLV